MGEDITKKRNLDYALIALIALIAPKSP